MKISEQIPELMAISETDSPEVKLKWLSFIRSRQWSAKQKRIMLGVGSLDGDLFGSPSAQKELLAGLNQNEQKQYPSQEQLADDLAWLEQEDHHLVTFADEYYPALLKQIDNPPIALFVKGRLSCMTESKIAIVGSRRPTPVGKTITQQLSSELAKLGLVMTSGMALGIDGICHDAALQTGGYTIAIMACGLDQIYPRQHKSLFHHIAKDGCVVSEYPLGTPPSRYNFPYRNRIVSGMSTGVVIIEAAQKSGTLITARLTLEQNRELMVVPGSALSKQYSGSHDLIAQGATIVTSANDILQQLAVPLRDSLQTKLEAKPDQPHKANLPRNHQKLLDVMGAESSSLEQIIQRCGLTSAEVSSMLLTLELEACIAVCDDGGYVKLV